jgi:cytochrome c-type biogenesis protein CcmH
VFAFVVGLAGAGYLYTGAPQVVGKTSDQVVAELGGPAPGASAAAGQVPTREQVEQMVAQLAERMQTRPDDAEGWLMLGRSQMMLGRLPEALAAYERLVQLRPNDAGTLVDYADALGVKNGRTLDGEPTRIIERALKIEPDHLKGLVLAGTAAFNRNDFAVAVKHWERAVQVGPPGSEIVELARGGIAEARERGKLPASAAATPEPAAAAAPAAGSASAAVRGTVRLTAALKDQAAAEDTVFIFARPDDGSRMPLAIIRKQVRDLPFEFTLDDSTSMSPATRLSGVKRVIVGARISKSGQAMPQPGDLEGLSAPVDVGAQGVVVEIGTRRP